MELFLSDVLVNMRFVNGKLKFQKQNLSHSTRVEPPEWEYA